MSFSLPLVMGSCSASVRTVIIDKRVSSAQARGAGKAIPHATPFSGQDSWALTEPEPAIRSR